MGPTTLYKPLFLLMAAACFSLTAAGDPVIVYKNGQDILDIGSKVTCFEDQTGTLTAGEVLGKGTFHPVSQRVLNPGLSSSSFWIRFTVSNRSGDRLLLELGQPNIDYATLYMVEPDGSIHEDRQGQHLPFSTRKYKHPHLLFDLPIPGGEQRTFLLKVKSKGQITLPLAISASRRLFELLHRKDLVLGLVFGVFLCMFFYNLFLYISVKDSTYVVYVVYIMLITLSQATLQGYAFKYLWPGSPWMAQHAVFIFPSLASIAAILFVRIFLHTRRHVPVMDKILRILIGVFGLSILLFAFGQYSGSFAVMQITTLVSSVFILYMVIVILKKRYKPAQYFLLAWSALLLGATTLVLRDYGILSSNNLTNNGLVFGSAVEVILLSFALADKINMLRKEKEESQEQAMTAMAEMARIRKEQNILLEAKVNERTQELKHSNEDLNKALRELKEAESQVVESEKMASLGQLTAGIAHEMNNPTDFVAANVRPLKRDIDMIISLLEQVEAVAISGAGADEKRTRIRELKDRMDYNYLRTEVGHLVDGIKEGSNRIAEIIKGLRTFSRLDEDDLKQASVNDGIDSTLIIVGHMLDGCTKIVKNYARLPAIECYPGKLNRVFLNVITNGLQAIKSKFSGGPGGVFTITTYSRDSTVVASFKDNGTGMDEKSRRRIFEPFFTTKEVNEGMGLGMSIVYNIIQKHQGRIEIQSVPGEGTELNIILPVKQYQSGKQP